jgi:hypothetical protein
VWGRELEEEPILAEEIITCFKLWSWGRKPCIITCWEESHKSSGVGLGGGWSFLESIITCRKKSIKALGGGAWRASSLAGS